MWSGESGAYHGAAYTAKVRVSVRAGDTTIVREGSGTGEGKAPTPGQAHDLDGADVLLKDTAAHAVIADKAYDAQARVIEPLLQAAKTVVIPPRSTRNDRRDYDRHLYKARHLIENFFARLKQYRCIATRYDKTARNFLGAVHLAAAVIWLN